MKICTKCGKSCFDNEAFCAYCGENIGVNQFQCNYCGNYITDLTVKQCPNCSAPVSYDTYSTNIHKKECHSCSTKIPKYAKYCPICGKTEKANGISERGRIIVLVITLVFIAITTVPLFIFGGINKNKSEEIEQTYTERVEAEAINRERLKKESETVVYRKMTVDELYEQYDAIKEGDWVELTGRLVYVDRGIALSKLECINITSENKECEIQIQAYNGDLGDDFYENCKKGEIVTIKANVDTLYTYIKRASVVYFEYERMD